MEDGAVAPIAKDEVEELNYDDVKTEDEVPQQEVLQESDVDHFQNEQPEEEVKITLNDSEIEAEAEPEPEDDGVLAPAEQINEEPEPAYEQPVYEPVVTAEEHFEIQETARAKTPELRSPTVDENRTPSPTVLNAKKMNDTNWPPKDLNENTEKKDLSEVSTLPKKRVSDLIARFNSGAVENDSSKNEKNYKSEYGATGNVGKIDKGQFA